jgi:serine/threonine-protein kinase
VPIVIAVVTGVLAGLHAAHEAKDERGESLDIVHRDVSPQNVIVSVDGIPRLLDFGIAKARTSAHVTLEGFFKGKIAYMPPEQLRMERVTRKADIYAAGVLMWELLAHRRLHSRQQRETEFVAAVVNGGIPALSVALEDTRPRISAERWQSIVALERVVGRALAVDAADRWSTAQEMAEAILAAHAAATGAEVAHLVKSLGAEYLAQREASIAANEESVRSTSLRASPPVSGAIRREALTLEAPPSAPPPAPVSSATPVVVAPPPRPDVRALAPWIVTGGALVVIGVLVGVLSAREQQATTSEPVTAGSVTIVASEPTATATATPTASTTASATPTAPAKPPIVFTSAPRIVLAPPPRPTHAAAAPSAPAAPASAPSKTDCNPPFYFDGSKKVFKSNCI